jgi:hypothetical protein
MTRLAMRPGKVVLEERPALPHHVPVALPADQAGCAGDQRVLPQRDVREDHQRPHQENQAHHTGEHRPLSRQRGLSVERFHERHQLADEYRDGGVDQGHGETGDEHERVPALGLAHEVPVEREQARRRLARTRAGRPANARLKIFEHDPWSTRRDRGGCHSIEHRARTRNIRCGDGVILALSNPVSPITGGVK